jgi:hypothetical protein
LFKSLLGSLLLTLLIPDSLLSEILLSEILSNKIFSSDLLSSEILSSELLLSSIKKYYVSIYKNKPIGKNLLLRVLSEQYTLLKNSVAIFKVKEKELLVVIRLLSITANRLSKVKETGNIKYFLGASYILK